MSGFMAKHHLLVPSVLAVFIFGFCVVFIMNRETKEFSVSEVLSITIPDFPPGGTIPVDFTCNGENISPSVIISNVPPQTRTLALVMHDPDAPNGAFYHWLVWNIPPESTEITAATPPEGSVQGTNGFNREGYGGPCPPSGVHRYIFTVYALDGTLNLKASAKFDQLKPELDAHSLGSVTYLGTYGANR
jgi:Raf kinase inhibitor-like YbhB/YbcL family protein